MNTQITNDLTADDINLMILFLVDGYLPFNRYLQVHDISEEEHATKVRAVYEIIKKKLDIDFEEYSREEDL